MRADIKDRWLQKLTELKQGRNRLCTIDHDGIESFCCWGVLCEVAREDGLVIRRNDERFPITGEKRGIYSKPNADAVIFSAYPPDEVIEWAGIDRNEIKNEDTVHYLAALNDNGSNFAYISSEIQEYL